MTAHAPSTTHAAHQAAHGPTRHAEADARPLVINANRSSKGRRRDRR